MKLFGKRRIKMYCHQRKTIGFIVSILLREELKLKLSILLCSIILTPNENDKVKSPTDTTKEEFDVKLQARYQIHWRYIL